MTNPVDVAVTTPDGTSNVVPFNYIPPTVNAVSPARGPLAGGTSVTITGTGLTGATAVNFGPTPAPPGFTVNPTGTSITATSPAATSRGPVHVTVTVTVNTPAGVFTVTSATSNASQFTYTLSLNILTWNSTGETPLGATTLGGVINNLVNQGRQPHVIVIQEANQAIGGSIYQMLANLGLTYNQPPSRAAEGPGQGGRSYLLLTHTSVQGQNTFQQQDLRGDAQLTGMIGRWAGDGNRNVRQAAQDLQALLNVMRMPAVADLTFNGAQVRFLTWHAPLGIGTVIQLPGGRLPGSANPDAFFLLQETFPGSTTALPRASPHRAPATSA